MSEKAKTKATNCFVGCDWVRMNMDRFCWVCRLDPEGRRLLDESGHERDNSGWCPLRKRKENES